MLSCVSTKHACLFQLFFLCVLMNLHLDYPIIPIKIKEVFHSALQGPTITPWLLKVQ